MNLSSEPYFLKQHYKDQLAYLERDTSEGANICNVWVYNFEHELSKISELLKKYTFVAMVSCSLGRSDFLKKPLTNQLFYCLVCRTQSSQVLSRPNLTMDRKIKDSTCASRIVLTN